MSFDPVLHVHKCRHFGEPIVFSLEQVFQYSFKLHAVLTTAADQLGHTREGEKVRQGVLKP